MQAFISDLDNTLIYSYKKIEGHSVVCVETKDRKELSYMTEQAYLLLQEIAKKIAFVPLTTRSLEQYQRIQFLRCGTPQYALTSNGGILLYQNRIDEQWKKETDSIIAPAILECNKAIELLKEDSHISFEIRLVDSIFVYTKSSQIKYSMQNLKENLDLNKVFVDCNGEKLYVFPKALDKGLAVRRLKKFLSLDYTIGAGDSLFDVSMLKETEIALIPQQGILADLLKNEKNVVISEKEGIYFGAFILEYIRNFLECEKK